MRLGRSALRARVDDDDTAVVGLDRLAGVGEVLPHLPAAVHAIELDADGAAFRAREDSAACPVAIAEAPFLDRGRWRARRNRRRRRTGGLDTREPTARARAPSRRLRRWALRCVDLLAEESLARAGGALPRVRARVRTASLLRTAPGPVRARAGHVVRAAAVGDVLRARGVRGARSGEVRGTVRGRVDASSAMNREKSDETEGEGNDGCGAHAPPRAISVPCHARASARNDARNAVPDRASEAQPARRFVDGGAPGTGLVRGGAHAVQRSRPERFDT